MSTEPLPAPGALEPTEVAVDTAPPTTDIPLLSAALDAALETAPSQPPTQLHTQVNVRNLSLALLALMASVAMLHWAAAVFVPVAVSVLMVSALSPAVSAMQRWHIPRWLGAAALLLALLGGLSATALQLSDGATQVIESLPVAVQKVRNTLRSRSKEGPGALDKVQKAATQIEQVAAENRTSPAAMRGVQRVQIERPPLNVREYLWSGTVGVLSGLGQFTVVVFLTFFALASGDTFQQKLVRIAGPSLERKKVTKQVLKEITGQIQRYLLVQVLTSVVVGVTTGAAYAALGLQNAVVWGVLAGGLNLVPYIGSIVVTGASALMAFLQFGTLDMALAVGGASLLIHTLVGNLLTPWLTSRTSSMSPVAVFVSVLAWGWLWGLWGLLLGIPIMMAVKAICDRVEDLKAIGELLGH
ncbi:MAG: AI-2E family transporter [Giesbergeria sp.]|nr:AI-2E family transporter [Giesbergeria sp.]